MNLDYLHSTGFNLFSEHSTQPQTQRQMSYKIGRHILILIPIRLFKVDLQHVQRHTAYKAWLHFNSDATRSCYMHSVTVDQFQWEHCSLLIHLKICGCSLPLVFQKMVIVATEGLPPPQAGGILKTGSLIMVKDETSRNHTHYRKIWLQIPRLEKPHTVGRTTYISI